MAQDKKKIIGAILSPTFWSTPIRALFHGLLRHKYKKPVDLIEDVLIKDEPGEEGT